MALPSLPRRVWVPALLGLLLAMASGPLPGLLVTAVGLLVGRRFAPVSAASDHNGGIAARHAIAATLAATALHVTGAALFTHVAILQFLEHRGTPALVAGAAGLGAAVLDPWVAGAFLERFVFVVGEPLPWEVTALALPAALSPAPALVLAARGRGVSVLVRGLPAVLVMGAVAAAWVAWTA